MTPLPVFGAEWRIPGKPQCAGVGEIDVVRTEHAREASLGTHFQDGARAEELRRIAERHPGGGCSWLRPHVVARCTAGLLPLPAAFRLARARRCRSCRATSSARSRRARTVPGGTGRGGRHRRCDARRRRVRRTSRSGLHPARRCRAGRCRPARAPPAADPTAAGGLTQPAAVEGRGRPRPYEGQACSRRTSSRTSTPHPGPAGTAISPFAISGTAVTARPATARRRGRIRGCARSGSQRTTARR